MTSATVVRLSDVTPATVAAPPEPSRRPSWEQLVELEPALGKLRREIRALRRTPLGDDFCANARWFGFGKWRGQGYKPRLTEFVGWCAKSADPALRTMAAYQVAYETCYAALPNCRDCACARPEHYH